MHFVEQHCIGKSDPRYAAIDVAAFASKSLYNAATYAVRQAYIFQKRTLSYLDLYHRMKHHDAYKAYETDPSTFLGRPALPRYKDKTNGRNVLVYTIQAISKAALGHGVVVPSGLPIEIKTKHANVDQVRIVPRKGYSVVEVVYERAEPQAQVDPSLYAGIDIGINNLATLTSNKRGFVPRIVNGRPVKSMNQFYNKRKTELQSKLGTTGTTARMEHITNKRTRCIDHFLYTASKQIIDLLVKEDIRTLCIGKNPEWKQEVNLGKRTNQNFVQIPHARFIEMLTYKAKLVGIVVKITEESYTSKCSLLDMEPIGKHEHYMGKRVKRGLFRASTGQQYNTEVNGSLNIIRKVVPDAFGKGIEDVVVHPS